MKKFILLLVATISTFNLFAQEMNFQVTVNTPKLQTVDPQVFESLEDAIKEFLNTQKWTDDIFDPEERINGTIQLTITEERSATSFKADLAIQASRPTYRSTYETALINHVDKDVTFTYQQFQPLEFSKNTYNDNMTAILSFYVYYILGLDYDSFAPFGGEANFLTAQEILNNVPQSAAAANPGWTSLSGSRNRYWMIENILTPRVRPMRQAYYDYHRQGLDLMHSDSGTGRAIMLSSLKEINGVHKSYPNSMIVQMFVNAKKSEIIDVFTRGSLQEKNNVIQYMAKLDAAHSPEYRAIR
ncbi:MAG: DUF4835 family protein [Bacteroidetes bacterium]|nr:DUF4835 family protein [Bacteroidota bacterium]